MNQWQYETIRKCIISGMPAAAQELISAFDHVVSIYNDKCKDASEKKVPKDCNSDGGK